MPANNSKSLILLRDLRGGVHGRVWIACSTKGNVCVIKFAQNREKVQLIYDEQKLWNDVWGLPVRIQFFGGEGLIFRIHF